MQTRIGSCIHLAFFVIAVVSLVFLVSCGGGGGSSSSSGSVSVGLTDAPVEGDYQAVYVTVAQVAVSTNGESWEVVATPNKTYDLLTLRNGVQETLGTASLPAGQYTQVRLLLGNAADTTTNILNAAHPYPNYFINLAGDQVPLKVPSGYQTGVKIVQGFTIHANQSTELLLDFDAARSIVKAGSSGQWLLKPTIKVLTTVDYFIEGTVTASGPAAGVLVSAQVYNEGGVTVQGTAITDDKGYYKLFVAPGTYTIVGYKDGFVPYYSTSKVGVVANGVAYDFSLPAIATMGTATLNVTIQDAAADQSATVSIRQAATIGGNAEMIAIKSQNIADSGTWTTDLPEGVYKVYSSTFGSLGELIKENDLTISESTPATLDVTIP